MSCRPYCQDRANSDADISAVINVIQSIFPSSIIYMANNRQDTKEATDILVDINGKIVRVACRTRNYREYGVPYPYDFTIRSWRDSGSKTELAKIIEGFGDWFFYGFTQNHQIVRWVIVCLDTFRFHFRNGNIKYRQKPNGDGTWFIPFRVMDFPKSIVAHSERYWCR